MIVELSDKIQLSVFLIRISGLLFCSILPSFVVIPMEKWFVLFSLFISTSELVSFSEDLFSKLNNFFYKFSSSSFFLDLYFFPCFYIFYDYAFVFFSFTAYRFLFVTIFFSNFKNN